MVCPGAVKAFWSNRIGCGRPLPRRRCRQQRASPSARVIAALRRSRTLLLYTIFQAMRRVAGVALSVRDAGGRVLHGKRTGAGPGGDLALASDTPPAVLDGSCSASLDVVPTPTPASPQPNDSSDSTIPMSDGARLVWPKGAGGGGCCLGRRRWSGPQSLRRRLRAERRLRRGDLRLAEPNPACAPALRLNHRESLHRRAARPCPTSFSHHAGAARAAAADDGDLFEYPEDSPFHA